MFAVEPPPHLQFERNGWTYGVTRFRADSTASAFTPNSLEMESGMGIIPKRILNWPGHVRGNHPLDSFTALGPDAAELVAGQSPENVYAPLVELIERNGSVVLMGVGLERMTLLHLAEKRAGRNLFRRWANDANGGPIVVEAGGCSEGFGRLAESLTPITRTIRVGQSKWLHMPAGAALARASAAIHGDPQITHCAETTCERCHDAILGGPLI
jgi:aminoglycoside 3-N-acetyltransferase